MKNLKIICLTKKGLVQAIQVAEKWDGPCQIFALQKAMDRNNFNRATSFNQPLSSLLSVLWPENNNILFIGALGILVRSFAALLKSKFTDPAVVAMDEKGQFVISVLSGHWGGANDLAKTLAEKLGSQPVITTATDVWGKLGIDVLAKKWRLIPEPYESLKTINALLVSEQQLTVYSDYNVSDLLEKAGSGVTGLLFKPSSSLCSNQTEQNSPCAVITNKDRDLFPAAWILLRPANLIVGIGCRKGVSADEITSGIKAALKQVQKSIFSVKCLASADIKRSEPGLQEAARLLSVSCVYYKAEDLNTFTEANSTIKTSITAWQKRGVKAVCEPAAMMTGNKSKLILPKTIFSKVTIAIAEENWPLSG